MNRAIAIEIRKQTGYTPSAWGRKLKSLYSDLKRRHNGRAERLYGEVSDMLDVLEGLDPIPADVDLAIELNRLASRLREA